MLEKYTWHAYGFAVACLVGLLVAFVAVLLLWHRNNLLWRKYTFLWRKHNHRRSSHGRLLKAHEFAHNPDDELSRPMVGALSVVF